MTDFANQIANTISQYLPYTGIEIGNKYQTIDLNLTTSKMTMTFSSADYTIIAGIINNVVDPNNVFTMSGFYLKNNILSFEEYPDNSTTTYGFTTGFSLPHKLQKGEEVTLQNFTNTTYNTTYKVLAVINSYIVVLYPVADIPIVTLTTGLGFYPVTFTEGFNTSFVMTDEGNDQISFAFIDGASFTTDDIANIDISLLPFLTDFSENLKVMNFQTFLSNLTNPENNDTLIVDTTSLVGTPMRSTNNKSDSSYSSYSRSGFFDKNYTLNLIYLLERNTNDVNNQTDSGSDLVNKQVLMHDALISILSQPLNSDIGKRMSSITISNDISSTVSEGRTIITYELNFISSYVQEILLNIEEKDSFPIETLKLNENVIDFS